ncbi:MAG: hypothetical protein KF744_14380 [Taibaiella sp.]|nr:hypothetical protein [Taibaiella sp.]
MNWDFADDDDLLEIFEPSEKSGSIQKRKKILGWVKYKFSDRISGTIKPWEPQQAIADIWERGQNPIHFYNQKNLRVKIGSLVTCVLKTDGQIKKLDNKFLIWNKANGESFLVINDTCLAVELRREFPKGISRSTIRWNYRGGYLMIHPDNAEVSEKHYLMVLSDLWKQIYTGIEVDKEDVIHLITQMQSHFAYNIVGNIFLKSLREILMKELDEIIPIFRKLKDWNLDRIVWNWGGITMSPVNFVRWLTEVDKCQPLIQTQTHVDIWKYCLNSISKIEIENALQLLKNQKASERQIWAVEEFLKKG